MLPGLGWVAWPVKVGSQWLLETITSYIYLYEQGRVHCDEAKIYRTLGNFRVESFRV